MGSLGTAEDKQQLSALQFDADPLDFVQLRRMSQMSQRRPSLFLETGSHLGSEGKLVEEESETEEMCGCCSDGRHLIEKMRYGFTYLFAVLSVWGLLYTIWGNMALPGGPVFAIIALEIVSLSFGHAASLLSFPPLFGMLCAGLLLNNIPSFDIVKDMTPTFRLPLRRIAVAILLTRGALSVSLSWDYIMKFKWVICSLVFGTCIIEAISGTLGAYLIMGFPLAWSALIGCTQCAISSAAILPYFQFFESKFKDVGTSDSKRTMDAIAIAKSVYGLDSILAICLADCALGFIFGDDAVLTGLQKGLAEVIMGGLFGICWGYTVGILLSPVSNSDLRIIVIFSGGIISFMGMFKFGHPRGAPLAVFLGTMIAVKVWRTNNVDVSKISKVYDTLWFVVQPFLFALIGARTNIQGMDWELMGKGVLCLVIGMMARMLGSFALTTNSGFSVKQRVFLALGLCGKGTVQAAIGPVALNCVADLGLTHLQGVAYQVMTLATMTIFVSCIITYVLKWLGLRWLLPPQEQSKGHT